MYCRSDDIDSKVRYGDSTYFTPYCRRLPADLFVSLQRSGGVVFRISPAIVPDVSQEGKLTLCGLVGSSTVSYAMLLGPNVIICSN